MCNKCNVPRNGPFRNARKQKTNKRINIQINREKQNQKKWNIVKDKQGITKDKIIPPLITKAYTLSLNLGEKTDFLARPFSSKMTVPYPEHKPPILLMSNEKDRSGETPMHVNEKSHRPGGITPQLLKKCAKGLASPLTITFNICLSSCKRLTF